MGFKILRLTHFQDIRWLPVRPTKKDTPLKLATSVWLKTQWVKSFSSINPRLRLRRLNNHLLTAPSRTTFSHLKMLSTIQQVRSKNTDVDMKVFSSTRIKTIVKLNHVSYRTWSQTMTANQNSKEIIYELVLNQTTKSLCLRQTRWAMIKSSAWNVLLKTWLHHQRLRLWIRIYKPKVCHLIALSR